VGVENLFDRRYAGSVVINATRSRFFEPGLPRRFTVVVRLQAE
jgi:iron complex outermembrane receptor protein